ncbi:MAG TPA: hypothetical protein VMU45_01555 [Candidatus Eisenbacteria bacterium]|nr:hypothetical protein [Candidatus Eisenbacteria bacterium]
MTVFGVILFGCLTVELLGDWFSRGKDYVIACQFNYVVKALIYMAIIIAVGLNSALWHGNLAALLAILLLAICAGVIFARYRGVPVSPLVVVLVVSLPFMVLAQAIINLTQPKSTKSR